MSDYFGFNPAVFSDEELLAKLTALQARLYSAYAMGMSNEVKNQIQNMSQQIEQEMYTRSMITMQRAWDAQFPDTIETEPDLKSGGDKKEIKTSKTQKNGSAERPANAPTFNKVYRKK